MEDEPSLLATAGGADPETKGLHLHNRPIIILETCFGFYNVLATYRCIHVRSSVRFCLYADDGVAKKFGGESWAPHSMM